MALICSGSSHSPAETRQGSAYCRFGPRIRSHCSSPKTKLTTAEALLVAEIVSPGSGYTATVDKLAEYAYEGIPVCLIVHLDGDLYIKSIQEYRLDRASRLYRLAETRDAGSLALESPFPATIRFADLEGRPSGHGHAVDTRMSRVLSGLAVNRCLAEPFGGCGGWRRTESRQVVSSATYTVQPQVSGCIRGSDTLCRMGMLFRARGFFGLTAAVAFVAVVMQSVNVGLDATGPFATPQGRVLNLFCYFTIDSNLLVAAVCVALVVAPLWNSVVLRVFRLAALICILVTGLVFQIALASQNLGGLRLSPAIANVLLHGVEPVLYPLGWLLFGPRGWISRRIIGLAVLPPIGWLVFTLARGPIVHWYPYPFMDVAKIGYLRSLLDCGVVAIVFLALTAAAAALDRYFVASRSRTRTIPATPSPIPAAVAQA